MLKIYPLSAGAAALALGLAMSSGTAPVNAQQAEDQGQSQTSQIDEAKLQTFARAQNKVSKINQDAMQRMQSASSAEESERIRNEAQAEMARSVEESGMTIDEFNQIATAAQADEGLRQKIMELQERPENR